MIAQTIIPIYYGDSVPLTESDMLTLKGVLILFIAINLITSIICFLRYLKDSERFDHLYRKPSFASDYYFSFDSLIGGFHIMMFLIYGLALIFNIGEQIGKML